MGEKVKCTYLKNLSQADARADAGGWCQHEGCSEDCEAKPAHTLFLGDYVDRDPSKAACERERSLSLSLYRERLTIVSERSQRERETVLLEYLRKSLSNREA